MAFIFIGNGDVGNEWNWALRGKSAIFKLGCPIGVSINIERRLVDSVDQPGLNLH